MRLVLLALALSGLASAPSDAAGVAADRWTAEQIALIASLRSSLLPPAPRDESNAVDGLPAAITLGRRLFNDTRFSREGTVSCATCHAPDRQFQDGLPVARGVGTGTRRSMPLVGAAHGPWLFWDGRKDSLWAQALGPLEDALEHGGNRTRYVQLVQARYKAEFENLFGPLPDFARLPSDAGPLGTPAERQAWDAMPAAARDAVSRTFANIGKAIAAYEKTLRYGESRFDRYAQAVVTGDTHGGPSLSPAEVRGLRTFIGKGECVTCHNGPLLTDQHFHNTGVPARDARAPDRGRAAAVDKVRRDEFNCLGRFSDAPPERCQELRFMVDDDPALLGAFKTPSLRNVALRPPYMHAGQFADLERVVSHYAAAPAAAIGRSELAQRGGASGRPSIRLTTDEIGDLVAFLGSLSGPIVESAPAPVSGPALPLARPRPAAAP